MKCILISEENHGIIGVAANYRSAIIWLIKEGWLDDYTCFYLDDGCIDMKDYIPNWRQYLLSLNNKNDFNKIMNDMFNLREIEIYNAAD